MAIKELELFHGAVLAKLVRRDRPINLTMIEFDSDKSSRAYELNTVVTLYVKYSKSPQERERKGYESAWQFTFTAKHIKELCSLIEDKQVYAIFVCGDSNVNNKMEICLLYPEDIDTCLDLSYLNRQSLHIATPSRGKFRVWGSKNGEKGKFLVEKGRIDNWEVPGS